jgi:hypothetical protein
VALAQAGFLLPIGGRVSDPANVAFADNCSGSVTSVTVSSETHEVAKGHSVTFFTSRTSSTGLNGDNSPFNAVGVSSGYTLAMPDGKTMTSGISTRKTSTGDSESDVWSITSGDKRGTWKIVAGTGAFAGKNNSGWFDPPFSDGTVSVGNWGGNCQ